MNTRSSKIMRMLSSNGTAPARINEGSSRQPLGNVKNAPNQIKILSQVIIKKSQPYSLEDVSKSDTNCQLEEITSTSHYENSSANDLDDWSEDKSSGSEYLPSDCSIIYQNESDEESHKSLKFEESLKLSNEHTSNPPPADINLNELSYAPNHNKLIQNEQVGTSSMEPNIVNISEASKVIQNEQVCTSSMQPNKVNISAARKANRKRIRNKGHSCYFCQKIILNSARHLEVMHGSENSVAKLLAMPKKSKSRRNGFATLIRSGDFYHNVNVLSTKQGELILVRRPTEDELKFNKFSDYGPCPNCLGFMLKKHIWHHIKISCTIKKSIEPDNKLVIAESNALINNTFGTQFSSDFVHNISSKLRNDVVGEYCKDDNLILQFGAMQFEKYGTTQCELIRQSMRQLGRFTLQLRNVEKSNRCLSDFLVPEKFDIIVQATKLLCVSHKNIAKRPEFEIPSLALKIGYALKKCASIKRGICLKGGNLKGNETLLAFLNLMELEWSIRISSNALATLSDRKMNATQLLPVTSDLMKLGQYINDNMVTARNSLLECPSTTKWSLLATLCLSKIILFNKRRSGEASRMKIKDFVCRPNWNEQCTQELKDSLTDFEKKLSEQLIVVQIVGKRGRHVPILLNDDTKRSVEVLIKIRDVVDISKENPHVFARTGNSTGNIRGHDSLRKCCLEAKLENPENITSTKLRKYIATVCQIFNLSENEYDWLARHLGHDIRVHRDYYRLHESAVELTKVSRLLMVVDEGQANKFAGKKLEEINLNDMPDVDEVENDKEEDEDAYDNEDSHDDNKHADEDRVLTSPAVVTKRKKLSKKGVKRPWSSEEKDAVFKFFKGKITKGIVPGKADCTNCIQKYSLLNNRSWTDVKFCVKNQIDKIKKTLKK